MAFAKAYRRQVALLVRTLPAIAKETCFAMKGGTAINLFIRDLPRLSVDIDLTYLPIKPRTESLAEINAALLRIAEQIPETMPGTRVTPSRSRENVVTKLIVRSDTTQIKIEVTPVLRGCVFNPEIRTVAPLVEETFGFAEMPIVSFADLYAGKIMAALDRQHPRDLFDIRALLANEGIDDGLRKAFIVYLLSHDRPMAEVLSSQQKNIDQEFERGFVGMSREMVTLDVLVATRKALVSEILGNMPDNHRSFLLSFERGEPDWALLGVPNAANLPAVRWRQQNLDTLTAKARTELCDHLELVLTK
jgi:predicted nucleotidyltransferase component of viral defense system